MSGEIDAGPWPVDISRGITSDDELAQAFLAMGDILRRGAITEEQDYYLEALSDRVWEYEQVYHPIEPDHPLLPDDLQGKPLEEVIPALIRRGWDFKPCPYMKYRSYVAKTQSDVEAGVIHGKVTNTRDVITFQGRTPAEARLEFWRSVDNYLESLRQQPQPEIASS